MPGDRGRAPRSGARAVVCSRELDKLGQAWVKLLSRWDWHWFATFTFRDCPGPNVADRYFALWFRWLARSCYGIGRGKGLAPSSPWCARATEYQKRGAIHFHALIRFDGYGLVPDRVAAGMRWESWGNSEENSGPGWARVEEVRSPGIAAKYVTKYASKGGQISFMGDRPRGLYGRARPAV